MVMRVGVPVRRGVEATALDDTGDGVLVGTTAGPVRTGWLVGCDGGHSAVRRLAGIDFPGTDPELTAQLRPGVLLIDAGKSPGSHQLSQDAIVQAMLSHARLGRQVVRLKGGDPFVLGRGGEEVLACTQAGVPCSVVPGLSSVTAAPR